MTSHTDIIQRKVLRALMHSTVVQDENIRWRTYRFDKVLLASNLKPLGHVPEDLIETIASRYGLCVLRTDPLTLRIKGFERKIDRQTLAESLGAAGVQFFPTRQSAMRSAFESARELAYFGYGKFEDQCITCPIAQIAHAIDSSIEVPEKGIMLRDLRESFKSDEDFFHIISKDTYFHAACHNEEELHTFQTKLRENPINLQVESKCEEFFSRKVTVGPRDSLRWVLGSRHPWFDWERAQTHIQNAFNHFGKDNFNTPQIVYYTYEPSIDEMDIDVSLTHNEEVVEAFAQSIRQAVQQKDDSILSAIQDYLTEISTWILDIHHDYPDFDLESEGHLGASTHFEFISHSIHNKVNQELLGNQSETRRNLNIHAHIEARGLDKIWFKSLSEEQVDAFYLIIHDLLKHYDEEGGIATSNGIQLYKRIPCTMFILQEIGKPEPHDDEKLLDTFNLSQISEVEHASYIRSFPEISEQLVVFFILTLRHMLDSEHVPDLQPRNFTKDFLLLGLWGLRTPNLQVNLYVDPSVNISEPVHELKRSELRFIGTEQVETHPLSHIREDAKALRFAISRLVPQIEPSILRNIGTFVMAMEEFSSSSYRQTVKPDAGTAIHYLLDTAREVTHWGLKGSIMDVATVFEYLIDSSITNVQRGLDFLSKKLRQD